MNTQDILQYCLEEVAAGRRTPAECAAAYPHLPELEATLRLAEGLRAWPAPTLTPAVARRHEARLRAAAAAHHRAAPRSAYALPRWALAAALIVALLLSSVGTVRASHDSLPGQVLYPVKRAAETIQTSLTPAAQQADRHMDLAAERTDELQALAAQAAFDPALVEEAARAIGVENAAALESVPQAPASEQARLLAAMLAQIDAQQAALAQAHDRLPAQARAAVTRALALAAAQQAEARARLAGDDPSHTGSPSATATAAATTRAAETRTPPGNSGDRGEDASATPKCTANSPNSPNYCTPTPGATSTPRGHSGSRGQDIKRAVKCNRANPNSPHYCGPDASPTPPGNGGGNGGGNNSGPKCTANSPNSPNYCTPTPGPTPTPRGNNGGNGGDDSGGNGGGSGGDDSGGNGGGSAGDNGGGNGGNGEGNPGGNGDRHSGDE